MDLEQYEVMFQQEEHHWWYRGMRAITGRLLNRYYNGPRPAEILDAGCGTGGIANWLSERGRVTGVDIEPAALEFASGRGVQRLLQGSIDALPLASEHFDLVTSFDVIYHLRVEDDVRALTEFRRVLKPGGMLLIRVPAHDWMRGRHDVAVHTRHRYGRNELAGKLRKAGFGIHAMTYANSVLFPLAPIKRLIERNDQDGLPDLWRPPEPMNSILTNVLRLEGVVASRWGLPIGLSLIAIARRLPEQPVQR
jgi:SAM-dependent methyltransferase